MNKKNKNNDKAGPILKLRNELLDKHSGDAIATKAIHEACVGIYKCAKSKDPNEKECDKKYMAALHKLQESLGAKHAAKSEVKHEAPAAKKKGGRPKSRARSKSRGKSRAKSRARR